MNGEVAKVLNGAFAGMDGEGVIGVMGAYGILGWCECGGDALGEAIG